MSQINKSKKRVNKNNKKQEYCLGNKTPWKRKKDPSLYTTGKNPPKKDKSPDFLYTTNTNPARKEEISHVLYTIDTNPYKGQKTQFYRDKLFLAALEHSL